jgi:hypothetical protein
LRAIERAREGIASDRFWKARDRLQGALRADPANQEVLGLLGEVLFAMGDLPAAGRYWYLTERSGEDVNSAHAALIEKAGANSDRLLVEIPARPRRCRRIQPPYACGSGTSSLDPARAATGTRRRQDWIRGRPLTGWGASSSASCCSS